MLVCRLYWRKLVCKLCRLLSRPSGRGTPGMTELLNDTEFDNASEWDVVGFGANVTGGQLVVINFSGLVNPAAQFASIPQEILAYTLVVNSVSNPGGGGKVTLAGHTIWTPAMGDGTFSGEVSALTTDGLTFNFFSPYLGNLKFDSVSVQRTSIMSDQYIDLVNAVLIRLRESQVSSVSETDYSALIGELVNEAKQEIENTWEWSCLRQNIAVTLAGDSTTTDYGLTGSNKRTRVKGVYNQTKDHRLIMGSFERINQDKVFDDSNATDPYVYTVAGINASGELKLRMWPPSPSADTMQVSVVLPEDELSANTDATNLPKLPIVLLAYAKAISERGEDGGVGFDEADRKASVALGDAIIQDQNWFQHDELIWNTV